MQYRPSQYRASMTRLLLAVVAVVTLAGCSASVQLTTDPIWTEDDDRYDIPEPRERDPNYMWDWAHRHFFHPFFRVFEFSRYFRDNEAVNVNALGEVPNSSWFTNRHATKSLSQPRASSCR